ncbi:MAG: sulfatase-like hydrolase/transferase [Bacteroidales bacterium]
MKSPTTGLIIACLSVLCSCAEVKIDKGPFPIQEDEDMARSKWSYLKGITPAGSGEPLPNIIVILVDDLGKNDITVYDPAGVPTPSLEKLADRGVRFDAAYSTSSVCSPSRAGLLTGRYQHRFGFERQPMNRYPHGKMEYWFVDHLIDTSPMRLVRPGSSPSKKEMEKQGIPAGEVLLSEILSRRGYATGIFGKWHLGLEDPFKPNQRGFDEQYGFYEAFTLYDSEKDTGTVNYKHDYFANKYIWRQQRKGSCAIRSNDTIIEEEQYLTFSIADRACDFIEKNHDRSFFLYVPFNAPHTPFQVPRAYEQRFAHVQDPNKRVYYGMIAAMDDAVGQIMNTLDDQQLLSRTVVFFASDNGGATYTGATDNGILRAGKFAQFEGGINVPMMVSWPGTLPEGTGYEHPVSLMDIFTTSLEIAGSDLPGDRIVDGVNLIPYLSGTDPRVPHGQLFWRTNFNKSVRQGPYKLVWNERDQQVFLFDLSQDPSERQNLSAEMPELTRELQNAILEWEKQMKSPLWPGVMEFRFESNGEVTWWAI